MSSGGIFVIFFGFLSLAAAAYFNGVSVPIYVSIVGGVAIAGIVVGWLMLVSKLSDRAAKQDEARYRELLSKVDLDTRLAMCADSNLERATRDIVNLTISNRGAA